VRCSSCIFFFFYSTKNKKNEKTEATEGDKDGKVEGEPTKVIAGRKCLVEGRVKLVCAVAVQRYYLLRWRALVVFSGLPSLVLVFGHAVLLAELCK